MKPNVHMLYAVAVCAGAANRGGGRQHREDQPQDPLEQPRHQPGGGHTGGHLPGGPSHLTQVSLVTLEDIYLVVLPMSHRSA